MSWRATKCRERTPSVLSNNDNKYNRQESDLKHTQCSIERQCPFIFILALFVALSCLPSQLSVSLPFHSDLLGASVGFWLVFPGDSFSAVLYRENTVIDLHARLLFTLLTEPQA
ncbi:hypothetical protein BDV37DRAFT_196098 [Aspergillus pseudonomiae]|uniref:Uncharacterized protein n=1 Tax=Aspergillus pseudonomiae TaxID=1506151 RepID=A0A5N7D3P2_9EURO|nr:uncharacterized protein BDV37DRAFT_196098 [Aspergillus pseudonomiae]KAE8400869.1 hypothetical protein BDV37DRAFT_196098 [Aspergillus pseudonomiae]